MSGKWSRPYFLLQWFWKTGWTLGDFVIEKNILYIALCRVEHFVAGLDLSISMHYKSVFFLKYEGRGVLDVTYNQMYRQGNVLYINMCIHG